jgi:hypothetical protein
MKKILLFSILLPLLPACFFQPKAGNLVFDDSTAEKNYRAISSVELDYDVVPYVVDRGYVESTLTQVFGSTGDATLETGIYQKKEFGGACDRYAASDTGSAAYEFPRAQCYTGITVFQPANSNPMRYSYTTKMCETLVNTAARFNYVMKKVYPSWVTSQALSAPDQASITKLYQQFYQDEVPSNEVISAFMSMSSEASSTNEAWKQILITLCVSPEWQVY